jgi:hypothetical protein
MVQEADGKGKTSYQQPLHIYTGPQFSPEITSPEADADKPRFLKPRKAGLSFRVLQWMTDTEEMEDETVEDDVDSRNIVFFFTYASIPAILPFGMHRSLLLTVPPVTPWF